MSSYMAKDVLCPYYKKDDGVKICCEGIEGESSTVQIVFASANARRDYQKLKCCRDYGTCLIAKMNDRKWKDDL